MTWNATITLPTRYQTITEEWVDLVHERLTAYHTVTAADPGGLTSVIITFPADTLAQATTTALAVTAFLGEPAGIEVLATAEFDRRAGLLTVPDLLSVTEVAERLGVSRQAVLQRIESGSLQGIRVGSTWAVPARALGLG